MRAARQEAQRAPRDPLPPATRTASRTALTGPGWPADRPPERDRGDSGSNIRPDEHKGRLYDRARLDEYSILNLVVSVFGGYLVGIQEPSAAFGYRVAPRGGVTPPSGVMLL